MFDTMAAWITVEFFKYLVKSKGIYSIHSPFVFDFMQNVLHDNRNFYCYKEIEALRRTLLQSNEVIEVTDLGAGSHTSTSPKRKIKKIAKNSSTPPKYAQLLFRIANYFECRRFVELGTSLGLTTLYLSSVSKEAKVISLEGDVQLAALAEKNFLSLGRQNITIFHGSFEEKLEGTLKLLEKTDLAYLDGNHRREATMQYFNLLLLYIHEKSVVIIGDIHWSTEMREAWKEIVSASQATVTIDLFFFGIVFFRKDLSKQHFILRW